MNHEYSGKKTQIQKKKKKSKKVQKTVYDEFVKKLMPKIPTIS